MKAGPKRIVRPNSDEPAGRASRGQDAAVKFGQVTIAKVPSCKKENK